MPGHKQDYYEFKDSEQKVREIKQRMQVLAGEEESEEFISLKRELKKAEDDERYYHRQVMDIW